MNPYVADILDQPAALQRTIDSLQTIPDLSPLIDGLANGQFTRIVLTGMGSSFHGLIPLYLRLLNASFPVTLIETSELIYHIPSLISPASLIVAVSQSGRSAEIVRLLEEISPTGPSVIGVTNTSDSPLAKQSAAALLTSAGEEFSVSCKTYLATLAALIRLGDCLLADQSSPLFPDLFSVPQAIAKYLENWEEYVQQLSHLLADTGQVFLAGRGASMAAAGTGGLILKEAAHIPAEGLSCAAFRHGPFEMNSPHTAVVVFSGSKPTNGLNRKLVRDIHEAGGWAVLVESSDLPGPFLVPIASDPALPILEILPVQMMTLALGELRGLIPGQFHLGGKVTAVE